jgi:hypothetical protein
VRRREEAEAAAKTAADDMAAMSTTASWLVALEDIVFVDNEASWTPVGRHCRLPRAPVQVDIDPDQVARVRAYFLQRGLGLTICARCARCGCRGCRAPATATATAPAPRSPLEGGTGVVFPAWFNWSDELRRRRVCVKVPFASWRGVDEGPGDPVEIGGFFCNELACYMHLLRVMGGKRLLPLRNIVQPIGICMVQWDPARRSDDILRRPALILAWLGRYPGDIHVALDMNMMHTTSVDIVVILVQMATALCTLHAGGIVHYDIKFCAFIIHVLRNDPAHFRGCWLIDLSHSKIVGADGGRMHKPHRKRRSNYPYLPENGPAGVVWAESVEAATPWLDVYALGNVFDQIRTESYGMRRDRRFDGDLELIALHMRNPSLQPTADDVVRMLKAIRPPKMQQQS